MLLTGWDSASGITPPASSSSSVASTSFLLFSTSICKLFHFPIPALFRPDRDSYQSEHAYTCLISPVGGIGDFLVFGCRTVTYCHFSVCWWELFVYSVGQVLWIGWLSWRYILGGWALLYCPLFYCTVVCRCLLTVISTQLIIISCLVVAVSDVTDTYGMCVSGCVSCACSSQKEAEQEELEAGKAVHYTWTEPTGSRELCWKCGSYSGKLKSEEVLCWTRDTITEIYLTV